IPGTGAASGIKPAPAGGQFFQAVQQVPVVLQSRVGGLAIDGLEEQTGDFCIASGMLLVEPLGVVGHGARGT
ncbi:MAG: hypothetical protein KAX25_03050, partial [Dehalococcoidia bacterium]|nr:hypothetical protein [Dehalococcoidia bacterium]